MQRMGMVIGLEESTKDEYIKLHSAVWPGVLKRITDSNIRNYSIFLREPENLLFAYWEYHGEDFAADAEKIAADEETKRWWAVCSPMQRPLDTRKEGEWWASMDEVFHVD